MKRLDDYVPTPSLSDDKGKARLEELSNLYAAIPEIKAPRRGSLAERRAHAEAELQAAMIRAAAAFDKHREFTDWLRNNLCPHIEAYDQVRSRPELSNAKDDLKWRVERLEESNREIHKLLIEVVIRLPPEQATDTKQPVTVS
jgi:hypothetical protein